VERRAWLEISLKTCLDNLKKIKRYTGRRVMACVKASCYGLGLQPLAGVLAEAADWFGVATVAEALKLRETGVAKPILVLGPVLPAEVEPALKKGITLTLFTRPMLKEISKKALRLGKPATVHVKVDTGMGRIGVRPDKTADFLTQVSQTAGVHLQGLFTHLATAESADKSYARYQLQQFHQVLKTPVASSIALKHVANSAGVLNLPEAWRPFDLVRVGLLLYGVYPEERLRHVLPLQCALAGYARIVFVKTVPAGSRLSYGATYTAERRSRIATLGLGYADGLRRGLSNRFHLTVQGRPVPIVGAICMDQTLINVTGVPAKCGDVVCFLKRGHVEEMARVLQTAPQEILCGLAAPRLEKVYRNSFCLKEKEVV